MSDAESSVQPIRAGVIGLGWAGRQHMAAYDKEAGVELAALAGMEAGPARATRQRVRRRPPSTATPPGRIWSRTASWTW